MKQWEIKKLPCGFLFDHAIQRNTQLFVSEYDSQGVLSAIRLNSDSFERFASSAVIALKCPEFERNLKFRFKSFRKLKAIHLEFGIVDLTITKKWVNSTDNPVGEILAAIQRRLYIRTGS